MRHKEKEMLFSSLGSRYLIIDGQVGGGSFRTRNNEDPKIQIQSLIVRSVEFVTENRGKKRAKREVFGGGGIRGKRLAQLKVDPKKKKGVSDPNFWGNHTL